MNFSENSAPRLHVPASAFPEHRVDQELAVATLRRLFPAESLSVIEGLVLRSGVEERALARDPETLFSGEGFGKRNDAYRRIALEIGAEAALRAMDRAGIEPGEVDVLIDVSCTGLSLPALDVSLVPRLGLRADARRVPIAEAGCAAGALALGLAAQFAEGGAMVLVLATELCSLTLVPDDHSRANLISGVLFGDGASAAVVSPRGTANRSVPIRAVGSHLFPGTADVMGFDIGERGLGIVLQKELPLVLEGGLGAAVDEFLESANRGLRDVKHHWIHPGGRRVLETYSKVFEVPLEKFRYSADSLRLHGNLSSASVLNVLERALGEENQVGEALVLGVGPGLSAEFLLLGVGG